MKNEIKVLLTLTVFLLSITMFGILYNMAGETVESYAAIFAPTLAGLFTLTMFAMFYFGFNLNRRS